MQDALRSTVQMPPGDQLAENGRRHASSEMISPFGPVETLPQMGLGRASGDGQEAVGLSPLPSCVRQHGRVAFRPDILATLKESGELDAESAGQMIVAAAAVAKLR